MKHSDKSLLGSKGAEGLSSVSGPPLVTELELVRESTTGGVVGFGGSFRHAASHASDSFRVNGRQVIVELRTIGAIDSRSATSTWNQRTWILGGDSSKDRVEGDAAIAL